MKHRFSSRFPLPSLLAAGLLLHHGLAAAGYAAEAPPNARAAHLPEGPDFEAILSLEGVGNPRMSPDGRDIAYTVTSTDWEANRYDTEIWLAPADAPPFPLTRTETESSTEPRWSPDGQWIAFLADRGEGSQIHLIRARGGEARPLTAVEGGVDDFRWSPDGSQMAVTLTEPQSEPEKQREELYGLFAVEDTEYRMTHLWLLDVAAARSTPAGAKKPAETEETDDTLAEPDNQEHSEALPSKESSPEDGKNKEKNEADVWRRLTSGDALTVDDFAWSPDGRRIAFSHRTEPTITAFPTSDLSTVEIDDASTRSLVARPGYDGAPIWSPDGRSLLFSTSNENTAYYLNSELAKIPAGGGDIQLLTSDFDGNPDAVAWLEDGIRFLAYRKTRRHLFLLDPRQGTTKVLPDTPPVIRSVDYSSDGKAFAMVAEDAGHLPEIYRTTTGSPSQRITSARDTIADWDLGSREVIEWESRDGTQIEGVLHKPPGFEPGRRYPLLVIIHGGPAGISVPRPIHSYVYPVQQWLAKGAMILLPNYRGSTGYGEAFRAKNVRNLGIGDAWDVLSGVDHLIAAGLADPEHLGAMGWSQGGYISAFLATTTGRFKAISVGAGISNWMTYYVNTDIHPFTRHYLQATPWDDPQIYAATSPITTVKNATTPTLIQHGENDRRVPVANAYELYQGLQDVGVDTRLVIYKDFGHGISKPKERLAAVWHNWQWFAKHLWNEDVELPLDED